MEDFIRAERTLCQDIPTKDVPNSIGSDIQKKGYYVFENSIPPREWFDEMYGMYDRIESLLDRELLNEWSGAVNEWHARNDNRSYFCGAPPIYKDRSDRPDKRDKSYLQWCIHFAYSDAFKNTQIASYDVVQQFSDRMRKLHCINAELYYKTLLGLRDEHPEIFNRFSAREKALPIVFKLLSYNPNPDKYATNPHYDKSAFALILDSDDEDVRFRVAAHNEPNTLSSFERPMEYPDKRGTKSNAVLLPGLFLREIGVSDLQPSPHFVLPVEQDDNRHSLVSFLLIPHLEGTDDLPTDAPYINDVDSLKGIK